MRYRPPPPPPRQGPQWWRYVWSQASGSPDESFFFFFFFNSNLFKQLQALTLGAGFPVSVQSIEQSKQLSIITRFRQSKLLHKIKIWEILLMNKSTGSPLHRQNRENGQKWPCHRKHREFGNFAKEHVEFFYAQIVRISDFKDQGYCVICSVISSKEGNPRECVC